jgi:hypothetical protein
MNRNNLLIQLAQAQLLAKQGDERIARQIDVIARSETRGLDVTEAKRLIGNYQVLRHVCYAEMDGLLDQLDKGAA